MMIDEKKLMELIDSGADIEFSYNGKKYTILAWVDEGISIGEQGTEEDEIYPTRDIFISNCKLDGVPIVLALPNINVLYHS